MRTPSVHLLPLSIALYTSEFYSFVTTKLNPGGFFVTQSGPGSGFNADECFSVIHQTLRKAFDYVVPYTADIPSFGSNWAFNLAFNKDAQVVVDAAGAGAGAGGPEDMANVLVDRPCKVLDDAISSRLTKPLRFLDGRAFKGIFGVPKTVRAVLEAETRVMTAANPIFMY